MGRDGSDFQLSQRLGNTLQASGQPGQEVWLWLGIRTLQGTEAGPVQNHLAAQVPAQRRHGERTVEYVHFMYLIEIAQSSSVSPMFLQI